MSACRTSGFGQRSHVIACVEDMRRLAIIAENRMAWPLQEVLDYDGNPIAPCVHHIQILLYFISAGWFGNGHSETFIMRESSDLLYRIEDGRFPL